MNKRIILLLTLAIIIFISTNSYASFSTGKGRHTFEVEYFKAGKSISLQSFLAALGITDTSSINFQIITNNDAYNDTKQDMSFIVPSYKNMDQNEFHLTGPILDVNYQYIPRNSLFITPSALNAIQLGLKTFQGNSYNPIEDRYEEIIKQRIHFMIGLLSRSRREDRNLFSNIKMAYDYRLEGGWIFDGRIGMEFKSIDNFRLRTSYRAVGSSAKLATGFSLAVKVDY